MKLRNKIYTLMAEKVIDNDDVIWEVKETKDGLPIFVNEDDEECHPDFDYDYDYYDYYHTKYWKLLTETENEEWMDRFRYLDSKEKTERKLKAWADMWYQGLDGADYSNTDEDGELWIEYFDEFQKEYMLSHKDEVRERLERKFDDHEVVDWWFADEPTDTIFGYGGYSYDVFDLVVKFGKKLED
jgi:hypothetical protein